MRAVVLAGGFGTRLRPLTYTRPKPLLPIANRPHIEHVFERLHRYGITEIILTVSYLADAFEETIRRARSRGITVEVAHEEVALGTAGALKNAETFVAGETFVALNGDVLTEADLGRLIDLHRDRAAIGTILLTAVEDPSAFGVVPTDDDGRVSGFVEKPEPGTAPTNLINAGIYVLEPEVLERIPEGREWSAERGLFPALVDGGAPLYAHPTQSYWMDVGTREKYLQANMDALTGRFAAGADAGERAVLLAEGAEVDYSARVSSACLGPRARIEAGARVEEAVLLHDAVVEEGAHVTASILGAGARVGRGATVHEAAIADNAAVGEVEAG